MKDLDLENTSYQVLEWQCQSCNHKMVSVFPVGTMQLECGKCHRFKLLNVEPPENDQN